jgi:Domain of unknown function (DUF4276)
VAKRRNRRNPLARQIRIYFEGEDALREGFLQFFVEICERMNNQVKFIAGGGENSVSDYKQALESHPDAWNVLLKDSEGPDNGRLFNDLRRRHKLPANLKDSVFWMVQLMEAWFLADVDALAGYYGPHSNRRALRANPAVEQVPKSDIYRKLKAATKRTGGYHKTEDVPQLLRRIKPDRVKKASPNCQRIFDTILSRLS